MYSTPITNHLTYAKLLRSRAFTTKIVPVEIPKDIKSAIQYPHRKVSALEETNALIENDTWETVDLPKDNKAVGCNKFLL